MDIITIEEPVQPKILTFTEIREATERIEGGVIHTPLCEAKISKFMDYDIFLKCENLQYTGSCAERGIRNALLVGGEKMKTCGAIVPSNGSMALAGAYHASLIGVPVTVVLPERTSPTLVQRCSDLGAKVVVCGETIEHSIAYAKKARSDTGAYYISSDEPPVMAGLGSVGLEIVSQLPEVDALLVPVASGGLLAGVLVAAKKLKCSCLVYGVECCRVPTMMRALQAGRPVTVALAPSIADELDAPSAGANAFATIKGRLDRMLVVDESWVARAHLALLERERLVAAGGGVCALAALMQGLAPELRGKRVVCVITGGNVECGRLARVLQRGLGASGRLLRFALPVPDSLGGLQTLTATVAGQNAVLKSLATEQMWVNDDVSSTWVSAVVETVNEEHSAKLKEHLRELYPSVRFALFDLEDKIKLSGQ